MKITDSDAERIRRDLTSVELQVLAAVGAAGEYVHIEGMGPTALAEREALDHLISVRLVVLWPESQPPAPDGAGSANVRLSEMGQRVLSADIAWREQVGPEQEPAR